MQESWAGSMDCQGEAKSGILPPHASWRFNVHFIVVPSLHVLPRCKEGAAQNENGGKIAGSPGQSRVDFIAGEPINLQQLRHHILSQEPDVTSPKHIISTDCITR